MAWPLHAAAQQAMHHALPPVPQNVVSLSASAVREVPQDWLTIVFAVTRDGKDPAAVQNQLRQALDAALTQARQAARPGGQVEVRTGGFSLQPRYNTTPNHMGTPGIVGWQGTAELVVEGRDTAAIAALPGKLSTMQIARVGFSLSREARERVEAEVTAQAIERFRTRAAAVAKSFGFAGYTLREVGVDGGGQPGVPMPMMRMQSAMADEGGALPVEAGRANVTISVNGSVQLQ